jgi:hypothetical protein
MPCHAFLPPKADLELDFKTYAHNLAIITKNAPYIGCILYLISVGTKTSMIPITNAASKAPIIVTDKYVGMINCAT